MAAQSSFKRINNYSKVLSKHCRKQSMLIYILCGLQAFFMLFHILAFGDPNGAYMDFYVIGRLFGIAAALSGVLIIPAVFRELYNRQFADVEYSLPMSSSGVFTMSSPALSVSASSPVMNSKQPRYVRSGHAKGI